MSNIARKTIAELILGHNTGDGRLGPLVAESIRAEIYRSLTKVVCETEKVAKSLPTKASSLAADIRRDAAWAYRSLREMNKITWPPQSDKRVLDTLEIMSMDFLPEPLCASGRVPELPLHKKDRMNIRALGGIGTLSKRLYLSGVYHTLYLIAVGRKDNSRAQDLRVALHTTLAELIKEIASRANALRQHGLGADADALTDDWKWVDAAHGSIQRVLLHEGPQERSLEILIETGMLPAIHETAPECRIPSPTGMWKKRVSQRQQKEAARTDKAKADKAWETFVNGFRPGTASVILSRDITLQPAGQGGGLGMFDFNEFGQLRRIKGVEPMVHIDTALAKSHIPMRLIPEIANSDPVTAEAGESLLAGATREVLVAGGKKAVAVHMSKAESCNVRASGGPKKNTTLIQWLDSGKVEWIRSGKAKISSRQVFVYGLAEMRTTLGLAHFCFGEWVDFDGLGIQKQRNLFSVDDKVELSAAILRHYGTAVIGCDIPRDDRTITLPSECVGVVVRAPVGRATAQAEPMYDIQVGDTVLLNQKESACRKSQKKTRVRADIRHLASQSYNAFDSDAYRRYRRRG